MAIASCHKTAVVLRCGTDACLVSLLGDVLESLQSKLEHGLTDCVRSGVKDTRGAEDPNGRNVGTGLEDVERRVV